jgi:GNAT superfamily N-acetyltransferase
LSAAWWAAWSDGWLHVEILWVRDEHRNRGIGTRIMRCSEQAGRSGGCHGAWIDTSSARAHRFYVALGYQDFGMLENQGSERPAGHRRWFLAT